MYQRCLYRFRERDVYRIARNPNHYIWHLAFDKTESDDPNLVKVNGLPLAQQAPDVTCLRLY